MDIAGLITIKSTHQAIRCEDLLKVELPIRTIPTPRELSRSCGISILFPIEEVNRVLEIVEDNQVEYSKIYKYRRNGKDIQIEEIHSRGD